MSALRRLPVLLRHLVVVAVLLVAFAPRASAERLIVNDGGSDSVLLPTSGPTTAPLPLPLWTILILIATVVATAVATTLITLTLARARSSQQAVRAA